MQVNPIRKPANGSSGLGCISHNAYWRVKEHCKHLGKPCLFVETPSRLALERVLSGYGESLPAAAREA
ncbi:hypothetical protein [Hydrogenophaga sp. ZJX-1]|uniref:hypothetical protein n=1 Tax=Hydrogenophaga sp. ZJX-1 TaxID=3404778 RepID=UPI003B282E7B